MASIALPIEVEISPRFEIFYALHKAFAPPASVTARWRKSARDRLGARVRSDAEDVAPHPLMWAVLADAVLVAPHIGGFDDIVSAIDAAPADDFRNTILSGVPDVPGADLPATFARLLHDPQDYRDRLLSVLRAFWSRVFAEDFAALEPELKRLARQLRSTSVSVSAANAGARLGIPVTIDGEAGTLAAGRSGYVIPLSQVSRVLLLPSAFNLNRWWTKRGDERVDLFFPISDGTVTPNDALGTGIATGAAKNNVEPEVVFRALGDTTRYAIATMLARSPMTPTELARHLKVSKPTITHHVHSLRDAGLIVEGGGAGKLSLDRSKIEQLSEAAVSALFASEGKLKLSRTRKKHG